MFGFDFILLWICSGKKASGKIDANIGCDREVYTIGKALSNIYTKNIFDTFDLFLFPQLIQN